MDNRGEIRPNCRTTTGRATSSAPLRAANSRRLAREFEVTVCGSVKSGGRIVRPQLLHKGENCPSNKATC